MRSNPPTFRSVIEQLARLHRPRDGAEPLAKVMLYFMGRARWVLNGNLVFTVKPETVARKCDLKKHQVERALKQLCELGLIKLLPRRHHKTTGRRIASRYDVNRLDWVIQHLLEQQEQELFLQQQQDKRNRKPRAARPKPTFEEGREAAAADHQLFLDERTAEAALARWGTPRYDDDVRAEVLEALREARADEQATVFEDDLERVARTEAFVAALERARASLGLREAALQEQYEASDEDVLAEDAPEEDGSEEDALVEESPNEESLEGLAFAAQQRAEELAIMGPIWGLLGIPGFEHLHPDYQQLEGLKAT